uniref:Cytochrome c oxidase subunit 3 n=1 Tax=Echinostoma hortense TaxID=48216 RepID=A0A0M4JK63_9TREM|nr:cytochrome c oxidase subunit 3 [Echinostoma hortense]
MHLLLILRRVLIIVGVVSMFYWKLLGIALFILVGLFSLVMLAKESIKEVNHFPSGFWLFIISEAIAFGTLLYICSNSEEEGSGYLASWIESPLLACLLLTGSSVTLTTYHHYLGTWHCRIYLFLTIVLGSLFMLLQVFEFYDCSTDATFSLYMAVCFCTVGLHFLHVLLGLTVLSIVFSLGPDEVSKATIDYMVWYWHFVDYIWLLVYLIIYFTAL